MHAIERQVSTLESRSAGNTSSFKAITRSLQGELARVQQDVRGLTHQVGNLAQSSAQITCQMQDLDHPLTYQEDSIHLAMQRAEDTQHAVKATQAKMQRLGQAQQNMGNSLQTQLHEILERIDRLPAHPASNPWASLATSHLQL